MSHTPLETARTFPNALLESLSFRDVKTREDFHRVYPLLSLLLKDEDPEAYGRLTEDLSFSNFQMAAQTGFRLLAAQLENGTVVGTIGIRPFWDPLSVGVGYEINDFIVDPQWRGSIIAGKLFKFAEEVVRTLGGAWIRGMVSSEKQKAKRWYERRGYQSACYGLYKDLLT